PNRYFTENSRWVPHGPGTRQVHPSLVANSTAKENGPTTSVVCTFFVYSHFNRLFQSFKIFHFQNEAKCKNFLVIMSPICMRIKRNVHIKAYQWPRT
ncbi:unnamed protein product, partial [Porites evermanni]